MKKLIIFLLISLNLCKLIQLQLSMNQKFVKNQPDRRILAEQTNITNQRNIGYFITMNLGSLEYSQPFTLKLDMDTPFTWVPDSACLNCFASNTYPSAYDCSENSDTCSEDKAKSFYLNYSSGYVTAYYGSNLIMLNGVQSGNPIQQQLFYANEITENFYDMNADGLIGLGFQSSYPSNCSIVQNFYDNKIIDSLQFSLFLSNNMIETDQTSTIIFGGYSDNFILSPNQGFEYIPILNSTFWEFTVDEVLLGAEKVKIGNQSAILSTSFQYIGVPYNTIKEIFRTLNNFNITCNFTGDSPNPICPCNSESIKTFPNLTLIVNHTKIVLEPFVYVAYLPSETLSTESYSCMLQIVEVSEQTVSNEIHGKWVLGLNFLRYYYTFFDMSNRTIGLAIANQTLNNYPAYLQYLIPSIAFFLILVFLLCALSTLLKLSKSNLKSAIIEGIGFKRSLDDSYIEIKNE